MYKICTKTTNGFNNLSEDLLKGFETFAEAKKVLKEHWTLKELISDTEDEFFFEWKNDNYKTFLEFAEKEEEKAFDELAIYNICKFN